MDNNKPQPREAEIDLFAYLIQVLKRKEFIIKTTLAAMLVAAAISLFLSPVYLAETRILPPQTANSSMASAFAAQMGSMGLPVGGLGVKTPNDLYISLLMSKRVYDYVIEKQDLMKEYETASKEKARRSLAGTLKVRDDKKSGILTLLVQHRDPQRAADIANTFVEGLQNLSNSLAVTEASQRRLFFEEQLKGAKENLIRSEESLKSFQQRTGTVKIDDQAKAAIEETAKIRARISGKEVQFRVMRTYATSQNPDLQRLEDEITALKEELAKLESTGQDDTTIMSTGKITVLGTEFLRKMREYKYSESLYEILMKQYGIAKLDESREASIIQIVEKAEAPEQRIKPQRKALVLRTGMIFFMFSIFLVLAGDYYKKLKTNPSVLDHIDSLKEYLNFSQLIKDLKLDLVSGAAGAVWQKLPGRKKP